MKRLLILLTAVMAVSADPDCSTTNTPVVNSLVTQARSLLKQAATIQNQSVAHHAKDSSSSSAACLDASKNARDDINDALDATAKYNANLAIRGEDAPVNLVK